MKADDLNALLKKHAAELGEHFDTVLILAGREAEGIPGDTLFCDGSGNHFARTGMAYEFLKINSQGEPPESWQGGDHD